MLSSGFCRNLNASAVCACVHVCTCTHRPRKSILNHRGDPRIVDSHHSTHGIQLWEECELCERVWLFLYLHTDFIRSTKRVQGS